MIQTVLMKEIITCCCGKAVVTSCLSWKPSKKVSPHSKASNEMHTLNNKFLLAGFANCMSGCCSLQRCALFFEKVVKKLFVFFSKKVPMSPVHFTQRTSLMTLNKSCHKDFMPRRNTIVGNQAVSQQLCACVSMNCEVWSGTAAVVSHEILKQLTYLNDQLLLFSFSWSLPVACVLPVKRECFQASTRAFKWKGSSQLAEFLPCLQVAHSRKRLNFRLGSVIGPLSVTQC